MQRRSYVCTLCRIGKRCRELVIYVYNEIVLSLVCQVSLSSHLSRCCLYASYRSSKITLLSSIEDFPLLVVYVSTFVLLILSLYIYLHPLISFHFSHFLGLLLWLPLSRFLRTISPSIPPPIYPSRLYNILHSFLPTLLALLPSPYLSSFPLTLILPASFPLPLSLSSSSSSSSPLSRSHSVMGK